MVAKINEFLSERELVEMRSDREIAELLEKLVPELEGEPEAELAQMIRTMRDAEDKMRNPFAQPAFMRPAFTREYASIPMVTVEKTERERELAMIRELGIDERMKEAFLRMFNIYNSSDSEPSPPVEEKPVPSIMEKVAAEERAAMADADPGETLKSAMRVYDRNELVVSRKAISVQGRLPAILLGRVIAHVGPRSNLTPSEQSKAMLFVHVLAGPRTVNVWYAAEDFKLLSDASEEEREAVLWIDFDQPDEDYLAQRAFLVEDYGALPPAPKPRKITQGAGYQGMTSNWINTSTSTNSTTTGHSSFWSDQALLGVLRLGKERLQKRTARDDLLERLFRE